MAPLEAHTTDLPSSDDLTAKEMLKILGEIVPGPLTTDQLLFGDGTAPGELYLPKSWIRALHRFARRRYYDDQLRENRMPRQLPLEVQWVHCCKALGCNWRDGTRAETPHEEVAVVYDAIRAREGSTFEREFV